MSAILIVDDIPENIQVLASMLEPAGHEVRVALGGHPALRLADIYIPDLILLDVSMGDVDGFTVCRQLKKNPRTRDIPVIFLTARDDACDVVEGFEAGGADYVTKPFNQAELEVRIETQLRLQRLVSDLRQSNDELRKEMKRRQAVTAERDQLADRLTAITEEEATYWGLDGFVGKSATLKKIVEDIRRLQAARSTSVLITGESGTGKELVARAIHFGSDQRNRPFIPVNCSACPAGLADSLFFGHLKGAFTGADRDRQGYFERASGGTLFLDELGDMPPDLQAKLLRVLESRKVMPVGASDERPIDCRVLSATNTDLQAAVAEGRFRQDLYYRLAGYPVHVPPLRERREDIPLLTHHFINLLSHEIGIHNAGITTEAMDALCAYGFPGNIRELKNLVERAIVASGGHIDVEHLGLSTGVRRSAQEAGLSDSRFIDDLPFNLEQAELALMRRALARTNGNMSRAAKLLGTSRSTLYRRITAASTE